MIRAKKIEAVLCFVVVFCLVGYGLIVLRDLREIGPIVPDTQSHLSRAPAACDWVCQIIVGYIIAKVGDWTWDQVKANNCGGPCGGGGGGGFPEAPYCDSDGCYNSN